LDKPLLIIRLCARSWKTKTFNSLVARLGDSHEIVRGGFYESFLLNRERCRDKLVLIDCAILAVMQQLLRILTIRPGRCQRSGISS